MSLLRELSDPIEDYVDVRVRGSKMLSRNNSYGRRGIYRSKERFMGS